MAETLPDELRREHLLSREIPHPVQAKADLSEKEKRAYYGQILRRACVLAGFPVRKVAADELGVDEGQLGRWFTGMETAQVWRFHHHDRLRVGLLLAEAEVTPGARVHVHIELPLWMSA